MGGEEGSPLIELLFKTSDTSEYKSSFSFSFCSFHVKWIFGRDLSVVAIR